MHSVLFLRARVGHPKADEVYSATPVFQLATSASTPRPPHTVECKLEATEADSTETTLDSMDESSDTRSDHARKMLPDSSDETGGSDSAIISEHGLDLERSIVTTDAESFTALVRPYIISLIGSHTYRY